MDIVKLSKSLMDELMNKYYVNSNGITNIKEFSPEFLEFKPTFEKLLKETSVEKYFKIEKHKISKMNFGIDKFLNPNITHNEYKLIINFNSFSLSFTDSLFNYPNGNKTERDVETNLKQLGENYSTLINACIESAKIILGTKAVTPVKTSVSPVETKGLSAPVITYN